MSQQGEGKAITKPSSIEITTSSKCSTVGVSKRSMFSVAQSQQKG